MEYDSWKHQLGTLAMPKLFIAGEEDTVVTLEEARATFDAVGGPKEWRVLASGHQYDQKPELIDTVNDQVAHFLNDTDQAAPKAGQVLL